MKKIPVLIAALVMSAGVAAATSGPKITIAGEIVAPQNETKIEKHVAFCLMHPQHETC